MHVVHQYSQVFVPSTRVVHFIQIAIPSIFPFQMDEPDPDYVEVDHVLGVSVTTDPSTNQEAPHFLVKWQGLPL